MYTGTNRIHSLPLREKGHIKAIGRVMDKADSLDRVYLFPKGISEDCPAKVIRYKGRCNGEIIAAGIGGQSPAILQGTVLESDGFQIHLDKGSTAK